MGESGNGNNVLNKIAQLIGYGVVILVFLAMIAGFIYLLNRRSYSEDQQVVNYTEQIGTLVNALRSMSENPDTILPRILSEISNVLNGTMAQTFGDPLAETLTDLRLILNILLNNNAGMVALKLKSGNYDDNDDNSLICQCKDAREYKTVDLSNNPAALERYNIFKENKQSDLTVEDIAKWENFMRKGDIEKK